MRLDPEGRGDGEGWRWEPDEGKLAGLIALLAAVPSLAWGWSAAAYLSDDYWIAYWFDDLGVGEAMRRIAFEMPGRVLAAPYYLSIYQGIGDRPLVQALVLAAANSALILVIWRLGRNFLPPSFTLTVCLLFAVLPNRSSTRLWFVVGTYPVAMALALLGILALVRARPLESGVVAAMAVALYEGVTGLALFLVVALVGTRRVPWRVATVPCAFILSAALGTYLLSPRRTTASGVGPFGTIDTFGPGVFGRGLTDEPLSGAVLSLVLLAVMATSAVTLLPGFRRAAPLHARVRLGAAVAFAGAGPALVGGAAFAVAGLGDRTNLVPSLGVAILIGALLVQLGRPQVRLVVTALVVGGLFTLTMRDVVAYAGAVEEGDEVVAAIDRAFPDGPPTSRTLVVPALDRSPGVAAFVPNIDLRGAMHLRRGGDWSSLWLVETVDCGMLSSQGEWLVLDHRRPRAGTSGASGQELAALCEEARAG